jgi:hypothetical protein
MAALGCSSHTSRFHYDWTARKYRASDERFPSELAELCGALAGAVGFALKAEVADTERYTH